MFLLTFTGVVFRAEVAGFLLPFALQALVEGSISFGRLVQVGVISALISLGPFVHLPLIV